MYVQSGTLLLAYVFENFRKYELNSAKFLSAPGLARQAVLKKTKIKLDLLTDMDMLLMVEKSRKSGKKEEYVTLFIDIQKLMTNR